VRSQKAMESITDKSVGGDVREPSPTEGRVNSEGDLLGRAARPAVFPPTCQWVGCSISIKTERPAASRLPVG